MATIPRPANRAFLVVLVGPNPAEARPVVTTGDPNVLQDVAASLLRNLCIDLKTTPGLSLVKPGDA